MNISNIEEDYNYKLHRNNLNFLNFLCIIFHDNNDAIVICFVSFTSLFNKFLIQIFVYFWWSSRSLALIINFPTNWCISFTYLKPIVCYISTRKMYFKQEKTILLLSYCLREVVKQCYR